MTDYETTIGIDISKSTLDVCVLPSGECKAFDNTSQGIKELISFIQPLEKPFIVFEPTGGYERLLEQQLSTHEIAHAKVNARRIRDFARCTGQLAKTDAIDAYILASYAAVIKPEMRSKVSDEEYHLKALIKRRKQLVDDLVREKNRLEKKPLNFIMRSIKKHIRMLEKDITHLDKEIAGYIASSPELSYKSQTLTSVNGVGQNTAAILLASMPELGRVSPGKIASLAGLAPHNRDSGTMRGKRMISGGRAPVRRLLYMATLAAIRKDGFLRDFYLRLKEKGKPSKVALTAAMRKLIIRLNAKMRDEFYT